MLTFLIVLFETLNCDFSAFDFQTSATSHDRITYSGTATEAGKVKITCPTCLISVLIKARRSPGKSRKRQFQQHSSA